MFITNETDGSVKVNTGTVSGAFYNNGFAYDATGALYVETAGASLTGQFYNNGFACTPAGALYITFDSTAASDVINHGIRCRADGSVYVNATTGGFYRGGVPVDELGKMYASQVYPNALFANGEEGAWYDPSDFSTMYQDSAGTTPVTAVGDPVGLILDKSQGLVLGSDLVPATYSGTVSGTWSISPTSVTRNGSSTGQATLNLSASLSLVKTYLVTFTVSNLSGDTFGYRLGAAGTARVVAANGVYTSIVNPGATTASVTFFPWAGIAGEATISNISVKELPGNHATQATAGYRPLLAGTPYAFDLDGTNDRAVTVAGGASSTAFMLGIAFNAAGAGTARTLWSDRGTNTGLQLAINTSNQIEFSGGNGAAYTTVTGDTVTAGTAYVVTAYYDGAKLAVQVNSAAEDNAAFSTLSAGAAAVSIGANTTPANYFNDKIFGVVWTKDDAGTEAERSGLRSYLASKAGVTL